MKSGKLCPKCGSKKIGYIDTVMDDAGHSKPKERKLAESLAGSAWQMGPRKAVSAVVEAYVCTSCGYFEEYVKDASTLEWSKIKAFTFLK